MPRLCWSPITTTTTTTVTDNENAPAFDDIVEETPSIVTPTHVAPPDRATEGFETNPPLDGAETATRVADITEEEDDVVRLAAPVESLDGRMASHMAVLDGRLAQLERLTGLRASALPLEAENTPLPPSPTVADSNRKMTTNEPRRAMTEVTNKTNVGAFDAKTRGGGTEKNVRDKEGDATVTTKEAAVSSASSSSSSSSSSWSKSGASSSSSSSWSKSSSSSSSSSSWSKSSASPAAIPKHVTLTPTAAADNEHLLATVASLTSAIESLDRRMGDHMSVLNTRLTRLEQNATGAGGVGVAAVGIRATVVGSAGGGGEDPGIRATVVGEEEDIVVDAWTDGGVRAEAV